MDKTSPVDVGGPLSWHTIQSNYAYNALAGLWRDPWWYPTDPSFGPRKLSRALYPSRIALVADGKQHYFHGFYQQETIGNHLDVTRHSGGLNVLFLDGHAAWDNPLMKDNTYRAQTYTAYFCNWWRR